MNDTLPESGARDRSSGRAANNEAHLRLVRSAIARELAGRTQLRRSVPVKVGPAGAESWQVDVHELHVAHPTFFAWIDTTSGDEEQRIVIVRKTDKIASPRAAVEAAVASQLYAGG